MGPVALRVVALGEQLADELRSRIVRGRIPPGTHLVEDAVATDYNVSRGPVRDALRTLFERRPARTAAARVLRPAVPAARHR